MSTGVEGGPVHAVFIRAPVIREPGADVEVLAALADGRIVACREGRLLATSFHPELTDDTRMHAGVRRARAREPRIRQSEAHAMTQPHAPRPTDLVALVSFDGEVFENQAVTRERLG